MHSLRNRIVAAAVAVSAIAAASALATAAPAFAVTPDVSQTFSLTGGLQTWTVPAGVTTIYVDLAGGQGGASYGGGGGGAELTGALTVTPGDTLNVVVGGLGANGYEYGSGAGGGGGSFIYTTADQAGILAAAGGGGGAASNDFPTSASVGTSGRDGGNGGGAGGTAGNGGGSSTASGGGGLLTDGGGGNAGRAVANGAAGGAPDGLSGQGGYGGGGGSVSYAGGGGGGYSGGGGGQYNGNNGGGGGGGSFFAGSLTGAVNNHGGDGFVTIFYSSYLTATSPATALAGAPLTIDGSGLAGASVQIGGVDATVTSSTDTHIVVTIPAQSPLPGGPQTIDVTTAGGVTLPAVGAFTYLPAPTVSAVSPSSVTQGSAPTVTITGTGFTGATAVNFGTVAATSFTVVSDTGITATVPSTLAPGTVDTTVTAPDGTSATSAADQLTVTAPSPTVTSVGPVSGPTDGGTDITITGTDLSSATSVTIGGTPVASFTVVSPTSITAVTAASIAGDFAVTVTTPSGASPGSASARFTYVAAPVVTRIVPNHGSVKGGTFVSITGTGFTGATAVEVGNKATTFTVNSDTSITLTTRAAAAGTVDITVTTVGGVSMASAADQFTFDAVAPGPVLGFTGMNVQTPLLIAIGLLIAGLIVGAVALVMRRRREAR